MSNVYGPKWFSGLELNHCIFEKNVFDTELRILALGKQPHVIKTLELNGFQEDLRSSNNRKICFLIRSSDFIGLSRSMFVGMFIGMPAEQPGFENNLKGFQT